MECVPSYSIHRASLKTPFLVGKTPGEGNGYPLQDSGLENYMDRGAWQATVHGVAVRHDLAIFTFFSLSYIVDTVGGQWSLYSQS